MSDEHPRCSECEPSCEEEEANESCSFCGGRRFFMEPTSFGNHPDGMQRIACPECGGRPRSKEGRGT